MKRTTNSYKMAYKKYANDQFTFDEILDTFKDYTVYGMIDNTDIYIVDANNKVYLFLTHIGNDIYQPSAEMGFGRNFDEIVDIYLDDCEKITKLKGGTTMKVLSKISTMIAVIIMLWIGISTMLVGLRVGTGFSNPPINFWTVFVEVINYVR